MDEINKCMKSGKFHICFNLIDDPNWNAGTIYILNCIAALNALPENERQNLYISVAATNPDVIPNEFRTQIDKIYQTNIFHLLLNKLLRNLPSFLRFKSFNLRRIDFFYPGSNLPKKWIYNWGGWIPDFQYKYLPHLFSDTEIMDRERRNIHLASQSPVLAFSSQNAIDDYCNFFPQYKGNEFLLQFVSKLNAEYLKQNPVIVQQKHKLPDRYFIVCNQFWKHKDHVTLIEAMGILRKKGIEIVVVCTGSTKDFRNPEYFASLLELARFNQVEEQFIVTGFISREDQIQLIRRSMAVIQPSLFEGWSTVVEDARSLGKSIFLSDILVHLEQNPPNGFFFKQKSAIELSNLIQKHLIDLKPGPDLIAEKNAIQQNEIAMKAFGYRLLQMMHVN